MTLISVLVISADLPMQMEAVSRIVNSGRPYVMFCFADTTDEADIEVVQTCSISNLSLIQEMLGSMIAKCIQSLDDEDLSQLP